MKDNVLTSGAIFCFGKEPSCLINLEYGDWIILRWSSHSHKKWPHTLLDVSQSQVKKKETKISKYMHTLVIIYCTVNNIHVILNLQKVPSKCEFNVLKQNFNYYWSVFCISWAETFLRLWDFLSEIHSHIGDSHIFLEPLKYRFSRKSFIEAYWVCYIWLIYM